MVDMGDAFKLGIALHRHCVEAIVLALLDERGVERGERVIVRLMGELGRAAGAQERGQLGELLEGYRGARVGRLALLAALRGGASRIGPPPTPGYLNPYPAELIEGAGPASP